MAVLKLLPFGVATHSAVVFKICAMNIFQLVDVDDVTKGLFTCPDGLTEEQFYQALEACAFDIEIFIDTNVIGAVPLFATRVGVPF